jgi:small-conductance mechanosensitive channel
MVSIPNKELADKSISNLSRIQMSNVKQELRFKYKDADKLPKVLEDIKDEIRKSCPEVIDDGSRPFRAYFTNYNSFWLDCIVDAHFRVKLLGDAYYENRQNMLLAINRAVKKNNIEFALVDEEMVNALFKAAK